MTFDDIKRLDGEPIKLYSDVDPSARSMQIGNFTASMRVRHMIDHGHEAYPLVGGQPG